MMKQANRNMETTKRRKKERYWVEDRNLYAYTNTLSKSISRKNETFCLQCVFYTKLMAYVNNCLLDLERKHLYVSGWCLQK